MAYKQSSKWSGARNSRSLDRDTRKGRLREGFSYAARYRIFCFILAAIILGLAAALLVMHSFSLPAVAGILAVFAFLLFFAFLAFYDSLMRPLQTMANVVSALREEDYTFRVRGAQADDILGELCREVNTLADTLQAQRLRAFDAASLLQRVLAEMNAPLLAFDEAGVLRMLNVAAERAFGLSAQRDVGYTAQELGLAGLLAQPQEGVWQQQSRQSVVRWMVRRSQFRQRGVPHRLLVLTDVSLALREEEQMAWKRLIRVLGHEISNSLAPIHSIAASLRLRSGAMPEMERGLGVIESRADSLHRFVQSYRQLAQLPAPVRHRVALAPLLMRVAALETRLSVQVEALQALQVWADPDQLEQLLINLLHNAVEASISEGATEGRSSPPEVVLRCVADSNSVTITITDNGLGLANEANLFVPFYTTKKSGSGVGLVLARQIAEGHGGTLTLGNRQEARGCVATVKLPAQLP